MSRKEHFPMQVKESAKRRAGYKCEICGKETKWLEIHHRVAVWYASKYCPQLASHVLNSIQNAICLCRDCHKQAHRKDKFGRNNRKYKRQAKRLESMQGNLPQFGLK